MNASNLRLAGWFTNIQQALEVSVHSRLQRLGDQLRYVLLGNASLSVYVFIELSAVRQSVTVMFLFVNRRVVRSAPDGHSVTG